MKRFMKINVNLVTNKPMLVLLSALIFTIIAGISAGNLELDLNWVALAPKGNEAVDEYQEIIEEFPTLNSIIVLIESDNRQKLEIVANEISEEVQKLDDYVKSVAVGVNDEFMLENSLLYMEEEEIEMMGYFFADTNLDSFYQMLYISMDEIIKQLEKEDLTNEEIQYLVGTYDGMVQLLSTTNNALEGKVSKEELRNAIVKTFVGNSVITSPDGKMAMVVIQPNFDIMDMEKIGPGVNTIEDTLKEIESGFQNVSIRATGMHLVARDETASIESDSYLTTIISIILILLVLYFAFRSFLAPVFAFVPLILGIVWSMGLASITIGRLNMMTIFSAAMLLGLGIDYAIHMYSSYTEKRSLGMSKSESLEEAILGTGPSIITGALTTSIAFFTLNISSLAILKELGTVMGTGILTTLISVFWVLPALIMLRKEKQANMIKIRGNYPFMGWIAKKAHDMRYALAVIILGLSIFMGYQATKIGFDMNLMNLEPEGLESIELMNYMVEKYETSADSFSIQVDNIEQVYELHEAFEKVDGVAEVTSIASVIPKEEYQNTRLKAISELDKLLEIQGPEREIDSLSFGVLVSEMRKRMEAFEEAWVDNQQPILNEVDFNRMNEKLINLESKLNEHQKSVELNELNKEFYQTLNEVKDTMLTNEALSVEDLPFAYQSQFVSKDGNHYLISVIPDFDIWSNLGTEKGEKFLEELSDVEESITGTPIFMKALYDAAGNEVATTGLLLFAVLFIILLVHYRSIKYTLLTFVPLGFTLVFMVGTMVLIDIPFNMLNFLSVLLVIGIGLDDGVHILHHYKEGEKDLTKVFSSVGRAILLTTITTICGFGSLGFSSYRGIAGLGIVLAIGVTYALIFTLLVLPIFLKDEPREEIIED